MTATLTNQQVRDQVITKLRSFSERSYEAKSNYKLLFYLAQFHGMKMNGTAKRVLKLNQVKCPITQTYTPLNEKRLQNLVWSSLRYYVVTGELLIPREFQVRGQYK